MEKVTNERRRPKSRIIRLVSIIGMILFAIFGIFFFAFVLLPNLVSTNSIKSMVESKLNDAITKSEPTKASIAGAATSEINPFVQKLKNRDLSYRWKTGDVHAYEFSFRIGTEQNSTFKVQGDCQYTIANEKVLDNNPTGTATAFVIAPGHLATCLHVVKLAERITFVSGEKRYAARIVDVDPVNDLAILAYEGEIVPVELGSSANLELAESVLVLGFPMSEVLGAGIKVTAGMVSGLDPIQGGRAITIDGAINPGNSGGPVLNQKGEVVGLASATLQGERISPVGFASRVDGLRELMLKNSIGIKQSTADQVVDAKEIAKRVAPSVGLLEVSGWADNRCQEIDYLANYSGSIKSPVVIFNGVRKEGLRGKITVSRLGEVRSVGNAEQLPFVLASVPELLFQPFDLVAKEKWTLYHNYELQAQQRFSNGQMIQQQLRDRLMGREPAEKQPGIPAEMKCEFEVVSADEEVIRIRKLRHFQIRADKSRPSLEVKGEGIWEFDTKQGIPISLHEDLTVFKDANGQRTETPLSFKVTRIDPEIVQQRIRLAQERADKQKKEQEIEQSEANPELIDELISKLNGKDTGEIHAALRRLAKIAVVEEKRDVTLKSLRAVISGKDSVPHSLAWKAYMHWMNVACAPELRRIISKSPTHRDAAVNALFDLKQEEDLPLMIANLSKLSHEAKKSLSSFGPKVESAILEKIGLEKETFAQIDMLRILEEVGTQESVKRLTELIGSDLGSKIRIESTIRSINRRLGKKQQQK